MNVACRILADDLTGALDCAAAFADAEGVPVALRRPEALPWKAQVEVCTTVSRSVTGEALEARLAACIDWLAGARTPYKKLDSLLRGNSLAELAWLARSGRFGSIVFAPAFPTLARRVIGGRLVVACLDGTPPVSAMVLRDALVRHSMVLQPDGSGHIGTTRIVVPDARDDADLDRVVSEFAGLEGVLWCGSAGLALALARRGRRAASFSPAESAAATEVLIATASRHPVLRCQLKRMAGMFDSAVGPGRVRIMDFSSADELAPAQAAAALAQGAGRVVAGPRPQLLIAIGGDSLLALCDAAQVDALVAGQSPRAGWGSARLVGGPWDGVRCLSRSGAFGSADDLAELLASCGAAAPRPQLTEIATTP